MTIKTRLTPAEFDELTRPKLKLFLSVDVVGSTEFKQQRDRSKVQHWLSFFFNFYAQFPGFLDAELERESSRAAPLAARLWKALGDELIFTVELKKRRDVAASLRALRAAIHAAVENWHKQKPDHDLLIKGTAWLAGFPVGNAEVPLEDGVSDYIGPQVDTGFRLKEHATPRKLILSADLAYLLVAAGPSGLRLFFDGDHTLKGVLRGKPYPIIWIDCDKGADTGRRSSSRSLHALKDRLLNREPAKPYQLRSYLRLWVEGCKGTVPVPFIATNQFEEFRMPQDFQKRRTAVIRELSELILSDENEDQTGSTSIPAALRSYLGRKIPS